MPPTTDEPSGMHSGVPPKVSSPSDKPKGLQFRKYLGIAGKIHDEAQPIIKTAEGEQLVSEAITLVEMQLDNFTTSCEILTKTLDVVAAVHPFAGVAIAAFKVIIRLELTRRSNDKRIAKLHLEMRDLMSLVSLLQKIAKNDVGSDGITIENRLSETMQAMAKDIERCGEACDAMEKGGFLTRLSHSLSWEAKLAGFSDLFRAHQDRLHSDLAAHTSLTVHSIDTKVDMIVLMRELQDPHERKAREFIEEHGGAQVVSESQELMVKLQEIIGDSSMVTSSELRLELNTSVDEIIKANEEIFSRKFALQRSIIRDQVDSVMKREGDRIIKAIRGNPPYERLSDWDVFELWREMGWKGNISVKHFVYSLREYFSEQYEIYLYNRGNVKDTAGGSAEEEAAGASHAVVSSNRIRPERKLDDLWALQYLNMMKLRSLTEALDIDASSLITIKEVNEFTSSRPNSWSLLKWLAYWAIGFPLALRRWYLRIESVLLAIDETAQAVLSTNRAIVDRFVGSDSILFGVHRYLAGVQNYFGKEDRSRGLLTKFMDYVQIEEGSVEAALKPLKYNLDAPNTVTMVLSPDRPEKRLFPLLYHILLRALKIIQLGRQTMLHPDELNIIASSIANVTQVILPRIKKLYEIFTLQGLNLQEEFKQFSSGVYFYANQATNFSPFEYFRGVVYEPWIEPFAVKDVPEDVLYYGPYNNPHSSEIDWRMYDGQQNHAAADIELELSWRGICETSEESFGFGILTWMDQIVAGKPLSGPLRGSGLDIDGEYSVLGYVSGSRVIFRKEYAVKSRGNPDLRFEGTLNEDADCISGIYAKADRFTDDITIVQIEDGDSEGRFAIAKRPQWWFHFRENVDDIKNAQRTQERRVSLWRTVREAILYPIFARTKHIPAILLREKREHRRQFIAMYNRYEESRSTGGWDYVDWLRPLDRPEYRLFVVIQNTLSPEDLKFYKTLADYLMRRWRVHRTGCDSCRIWGFQVTRIICLDCSSRGQDLFDLCAKCYDGSGVLLKDSTAHPGSHALLQIRGVLPLRMALDEVERARDVLARGWPNEHDSQHFGQLGDKVDSADEGVVLPICAECTMVLKRPFWMCMQCNGAHGPVYICNSCNAKYDKDPNLLIILDAHRERGQQGRDDAPPLTGLKSGAIEVRRDEKTREIISDLYGKHPWDHSLVRLALPAPPVEPEIPPVSVEDRLAKMEGRLDDLQYKLSSLADVPQQLVTLADMRQQLAIITSALQTSMNRQQQRGSSNGDDDAVNTGSSVEGA